MLDRILQIVKAGPESVPVREIQRRVAPKDDEEFRQFAVALGVLQFWRRQIVWDETTGGYRLAPGGAA